MVVLICIAAAIGYLLLSRSWRLYLNYRGAAASGLPYVVCPIDTDTILYVILQAPLGTLFKHVLPASWYDRLRLAVVGWEFFDKGATHERLGLSFILVTAGINQLWCADPAMAQIILARRKDFVQLPIASKVMRFLGENIITSDGEAWARQRRIVAPNLNERISQVTWDESMAQAHQMASHMLRQPNGKSSDTIDSLRAIAINVLGQVGYGQPKPFKPFELPRDPDASMTYIDAISLCSELLVVASLVPGQLLRLSFMPQVLRTVGAALKNLPGLTADMLSQERGRIESQKKERNDDGKTERDNIMSQLVRLSDQGKIGDIHNRPTGQYLTDDEIAGNLFIFTGAGFDTTANTMSYAIGLLAVYPEWQAWMQEELDSVIGSAEKREDGRLDYATYFPRMKRVLAVMLETLRLFPPVIHISRSIQHDQSIVVHGRTHTIPGPCSVYINNIGLHFSRTAWGHDAHLFRPSRWLTSADIASAEIITPARGTFLPWSGGPRVCPGQKMAQVEFVTVFSALFARLRVEPAPDPARTHQESKRDLLDLMEDSLTRLTLQMNKPEKFLLRWSGR